MLKRASGVLGVFVAVIALQNTAATYGEEQPVALVTRQATDGTLDGWDFYCEQAGTKCGEVWQRPG